MTSLDRLPGRTTAPGPWLPAYRTSSWLGPLDRQVRPAVAPRAHGWEVLTPEAGMARGPGRAADRRLGALWSDANTPARTEVRPAAGGGLVPAALGAAPAFDAAARCRSGSSSPSPGRTARGCRRGCSSPRASIRPAATRCSCTTTAARARRWWPTLGAARSRPLAQADGPAGLRRAQRGQPVLDLLRQGGGGPRPPPLRPA